jgi:hypothetical protein
MYKIAMKVPAIKNRGNTTEIASMTDTVATQE